jgi:surfeit locus 1 family protein
MSSMRVLELTVPRFSPRLWPTLVTLLGVALLVTLGTWQLRRLAWKQDLIAHAEAGLEAPPAVLPSEPARYEALDFRHLAVRGRFLHGQAFAYGFTAVNGEPGAHLVTPLALDADRTLLVDRGWLPLVLLPPAIPAELEVQGEVDLTGVARYRGRYERSWFQPENDPAARRWYGWDIAAMAAAVGRPLLPLVLVADPSTTVTDLPHVEPVTVDYRNNHLGYAITWYGLAAGLIAVYVAFSVSQPESERP